MNGNQQMLKALTRSGVLLNVPVRYWRAQQATPEKSATKVAHSKGVLHQVRTLSPWGPPWGRTSIKHYP